MQINTSDEVAVKLVNAAKDLEDAAAAAAEILGPQNEPLSPLKRLVIDRLRATITAGETARRNFRYGHDCDRLKCDGDSHK